MKMIGFSLGYEQVLLNIIYEENKSMLLLQTHLFAEFEAGNK